MYLKIRRSAEKQGRRFAFYVDETLYAWIVFHDSDIELYLEEWVEDCKHKYGGED